MWSCRCEKWFWLLLIWKAPATSVSFAPAAKEWKIRLSRQQQQPSTTATATNAAIPSTTVLFSSTTPASAADYTSGGHRRARFETFDERKRLEARLGQIERTAASTLGGFYEPRLSSFSVRPGKVNVRIVTVCGGVYGRGRGVCVCVCSLFVSIILKSALAYFGALTAFLSGVE